MTELLEKTAETIHAGMPGAHISTDDYSRADDFIARLAKMLDLKPLEWNYGYGRVEFGSKKSKELDDGGLASLAGAGQGLYSPQDALKTMYDPAQSGKLLVIKNARLVFDGEMNRQNLAQLQQTLFRIKKNREKPARDEEPYRGAIVYVDETRFIPTELASLVYYAELAPPDQRELEAMIDAFAEQHPGVEIGAGVRNWLTSRCVGMNEDVFGRILKKAAAGPDFEARVKKIADDEKKQSVEKSGLLKYISSDIDLKKDVGGLDNLRWWLDQKQTAIKDPQSAREAGVVPAKGVLLVGMPGCGKTLTAKSIANLLGFPLLSLDMGSLMGKYVGQSEEQMRRALNLAEYSSPCVLWIDEIEKAFAGVGGDESGVSQRLFGYMLTWLQDHEKTVFVVATANDVAVLPPEFLRRGRFDEIFYIDFPNAQERASIYEIHLRKVKNEKEAIDCKRLAAVPADVKEAIQDEKKKRDETKQKEKRQEELIYYQTLAYVPDDMKKTMQAEKKKEDEKKKAEEQNEKADDDDEDKQYNVYSGSDIESIVNSAAEIAWTQKRPLSQEILEKQRDYIKPLGIVLKDKIARNKEKFGQYNLRPAGFSKKDLRMFEEGVSGDLATRKKIAADERCPEKILLILAADKDAEARRALLDNPEIGAKPAVLLKLLDDPDGEIKKAAQEKFAKSAGGMVKIMEGKDEEQKLRLLTTGKNIPEAALLAAAKDGNLEVRKALANYQYLSAPVMELLLNDGDKNVWEIILKRPDCPENLNMKRVCGNCAIYHSAGCYNFSGTENSPACGAFIAARNCYSCKFHYRRYTCKLTNKRASLTDHACNDYAPEGSTATLHLCIHCARLKPYICGTSEYLRCNKDGYIKTRPESESCKNFEAKRQGVTQG
jgi:SpoVK/Ycf46/Vps4 family AAA+-type ATPase